MSFKNAWSYDVVSEDYIYPQYSHQNPNLNLVIDLRNYTGTYLHFMYSTRRHAKVEIRKLKKIKMTNTYSQQRAIPTALRRGFTAGSS